MTDITAADLAALARYNTPTICNAIEAFGIRPRNEGFNLTRLHCVFPEFPPIVGFATTAVIRTFDPPGPEAASRIWDYYDYVEKAPKPAIAVIQDVDEKMVGVGAMWGEVNSNIHKAMGCLGVITDGGVRDLDEVRALGFQMIAGGVVPSHAYQRVEEWDGPVNIAGLAIRPGDILHADQHGVAVIPPELVREIPAEVARIEKREREQIELAQSGHFTVSALREIRARQSGPAH